MSQFQRGQFRSFRATNKIHLGRYETDIGADDEFDYDGHTIRYCGVEYTVPQLRGLLGDWFVPAHDTTTTYKSRPAGVEVRPATPEGQERGASFKMEEASEEEAVVGTLDQQQQIRQAANAGHQDRLEQLREQRRQMAARRTRTASALPGDFEDSNPNAPPPQNADDVDPEIEAALLEHTEQTFKKAEPVRRGKEAAATPREILQVEEANRRNAAIIAAKAAELAAKDPYKSKDQMGGTRHDAPDQGARRVGKGGKFGLVVEDADDGRVIGNYQFSDGATVGGEDARHTAKAVDVTRAPARQPVQVGKAVASTPQRSGAEIIPDLSEMHEPQAVRTASTTQVPRDGNVGIDDVFPNGGTGDVDEAMAGDDLADLIPGAAVAGVVRRAPAPTPAMDEDDEIAEIVENWSLKRGWQKRVDEAVEFYGDWPEALEAIYAIESEAVIKNIKSRLARKDAAEKK